MAEMPLKQKPSRGRKWLAAMLGLISLVFFVVEIYWFESFDPFTLLFSGIFFSVFIREQLIG